MHSDSPADDAKIAAQARLIEAYERNRWPQKTPELPEVLTYLLDQNDLTRADLVPLLGTPSRVSEVLSGKRELSITMIQRLRERFHIPADVLIPSVNATSRKKAAA
jgi:HTH-type transcriptional regulator/antitoxin HigA